MTFAARLPRRGRTPELALDLLFQWADRSAPVEVVITDGRAGPQVEIACSSKRVVLESEDGEAGRSGLDAKDAPPRVMNCRFPRL